MLSTNILNDDRDGLFTPKLWEGDHVKPILSATEQGAFSGDIELRIMPPGVVLFQAQRSGQLEPGRWFGISQPRNSIHADILFNIKKWGNDGAQIRRYLVLAHLQGYWGRVAGGLGLQFFVPPTIVEIPPLKCL